MGVPCVLGEKGVESIVELDLNDRERADFDRSAASVRADIERLRNIAS
jgi:malate dehydrogenase